jgi:hypothetical protein
MVGRTRERGITSWDTLNSALDSVFRIVDVGISGRVSYGYAMDEDEDLSQPLCWGTSGSSAQTMMKSVKNSQDGIDSQHASGRSHA